MSTVRGGAAVVADRTDRGGGPRDGVQQRADRHPRGHSAGRGGAHAQIAEHLPRILRRLGVQRRGFQVFAQERRRLDPILQFLQIDHAQIEQRRGILRLAVQNAVQAGDGLAVFTGLGFRQRQRGADARRRRRAVRSLGQHALRLGPGLPGGVDLPQEFQRLRPAGLAGGDIGQQGDGARGVAAFILNDGEVVQRRRVG